MKKFLLAVLLFAGAFALWAQPYPIGHRSAEYTDAARSNRKIAVELYYPAETAGDNVPVHPAGGFPVICFGHGFVMTWDAYRNIWESLTPEGFILVFPKTEGSLAPSHESLGRDMAFLLDALQMENNQPNSVFYQRIAPESALMGHSMGGGAAFLAAAMRPATTTLATLAAAETTPSAIGAAAALNMPVLVLAGGNDCVTPPQAHQYPMYEAVPAPCKALVTILGGSHCQMAESNLLCQFGEATCTPAPAISREAQHAVIDRYVLPWLQWRLKAKPAAWAQINGPGDAQINFLSNCVLNSSTETPDAARWRATPNPCTDVLHIQAPDGWAGEVEWSLGTIDGKTLLQNRRQATGGVDVEVESLSPGLYFLRVRTEKGHWRQPVLKF